MAGLVAVLNVRQLRPEAHVKDKGNDFTLSKTEECQIFFRITGAVAPDDSCAAVLFFAAVGKARLVIGFLLLFLLAATGMVGAPFGRTAANVAIVHTLAGHGMDNVGIVRGNGGKRTHNDDQIDHRE
jgi:hypothetical protein